MSKKASQPNIAKSRLFGSLWVTLALIGLAAALLFAFVLSPLMTFANNDGTIHYLPDIFEAVQWIFNLLTFFICYAITDFAIYRFRISRYWILVLIFSLATVCKYLFNVISDLFVFGGVPSDKEQLKQRIATAVLYTLIELFQYALVILASSFALSKFKKLSDIAEKSAQKMGIDYDRRSKVFPLKKLVSTKNPIQNSALWAALIGAAFMITNRLIFDIAVGFPVDLIDGLWMATGYLSDILFGVLGYFIMILTFNRCDTLDIKYRVKYFKE